MIRRYLPRTESTLLAVTAAALTIFYAVVAIVFAANVMARPIGIVIAPLFGLLAWGMWKLAKFAWWESFARTSMVRLAEGCDISRRYDAT